MLNKRNIEFYHKQYEMAFKEEGNSPSRMEYSKKRVSDLLSLLERKPGCALELGSGPGLDAINMNLLGVEVDALEIVSDLVNHGKKIQDKYHSKVNFIEMDFM